LVSSTRSHKLLGQIDDACELPFGAGVIHRVVESSKCIYRVSHHPLRFLGDRYIRLHDARVTSPRLYLSRELHHFVFAPRGKHYFGSARGEGLGRRAPDSTARPGNESYLAIHI
jgi:hypothetical protein